MRCSVQFMPSQVLILCVKHVALNRVCLFNDVILILAAESHRGLSVFSARCQPAGALVCHVLHNFYRSMAREGCTVLASVKSLTRTARQVPP